MQTTRVSIHGEGSAFSAARSYLSLNFVARAPPPRIKAGISIAIHLAVHGQKSYFLCPEPLHSLDAGPFHNAAHSLDQTNVERH